MHPLKPGEPHEPSTSPRHDRHETYHGVLVFDLDGRMESKIIDCIPPLPHL